MYDDAVDPAETTLAVASIINSQSACHWTAVFEAADCCCSVVKTLPEALDNQHFRARGLFDAEVSNATGKSMTALPIPIAPVFRARSEGAAEYPALGTANNELLQK